MKAATVRELKKALEGSSPTELTNICLTLAKFKKDNKELLTYLLFEEQDEQSYVANVKREIEEQFSEINISSYYFIKKSVRKVLRHVKKHIRYSNKAETEVELLLHFCLVLKEMKPNIKGDNVLFNIFQRQIVFTEKKMDSLHEDIQFDYQEQLILLQEYAV